MKIKFFVLLFVALNFIGCDMLSTKQVDLVGDITLINPHDHPNSGFSLVFLSKDGINRTLVSEGVISVDGNDTVLFAKCESSNNDFIYYKIDHKDGKEIGQVTSILFNEYNVGKSNIKIKYSFIDTSK